MRSVRCLATVHQTSYQHCLPETVFVVRNGGEGMSGAGTQTQALQRMMQVCQPLRSRLVLQTWGAFEQVHATELMKTVLQAWPFDFLLQKKLSADAISLLWLYVSPSSLSPIFTCLLFGILVLPFYSCFSFYVLFNKNEPMAVATGWGGINSQRSIETFRFKYFSCILRS